MREDDLHCEGHRIGTIRTDNQCVHGVGGGAAPALIFAVSGTIQPREGLSASEQDGTRSVVPITLLRISGVLDVGSAQALADAVPIDVIAETHNLPRPTGFRADIRFPLSAVQIHALEAVRRGGEARLIFRLRLTLARHAECRPARDKGVGQGFEGWEYTPVVRHFTQDVVTEVVVPKSVWAETVLPAVGYGTRHIVEVPLPSPPGDPSFERAAKHLEAAWAAFAAGDDRSAMTRCWNVWEALVVNCTDAAGRPRVEAFAEWLGRTDLHPAKIDKLKGLLYALAAFNHLGRHDRDETPTPIDHRDAEFALIVTQMAASYLAKLGALTPIAR